MSIFAPTPLTLLSQLRDSDAGALWQVSWKRFLELYHAPLLSVAHACYRKHTNGLMADIATVEDIVANSIVEFFGRSQYRFNRDKGRLRDYLRCIVNGKVVDMLRKQRPFDHLQMLDHEQLAPEPTREEIDAFNQALLATLIEDLRQKVSMRQFQIFEQVKLKGQPAQQVADDMGLPRARIDREVYKAMTKLREIAQQPDYQEELY